MVLAVAEVLGLAEGAAAGLGAGAEEKKLKLWSKLKIHRDCSGK